jgi:hypothetical protein
MALPCSEARIGRVIAFPAASAFPGSPERLSRQLSVTAGDLVRSISSVLEDLVLCAIEKRTAEEFRAVREDVFPKYFEAMHALSSLASIVVPAHVLDRLSNEFFSETEAACREHARAAFGAELQEQLVFTVWTLRKTADLCRQITVVPLPEHLRDADKELSRGYARTAVWSRFHLDCLLQSMQLRRPVYPDVCELIIDGLRAAVNAYAWARRGLDLRSPENDADPACVEWDDEDRQLLGEATYDLVSEV